MTNTTDHNDSSITESLDNQDQQNIIQVYYNLQYLYKYCGQMENPFERDMVKKVTSDSLETIFSIFWNIYKEKLRIGILEKARKTIETTDTFDKDNLDHGKLRILLRSCLIAGLQESELLRDTN